MTFSWRAECTQAYGELRTLCRRALGRGGSALVAPVGMALCQDLRNAARSKPTVGKITCESLHARAEIAPP